MFHSLLKPSAQRCLRLLQDFMVANSPWLVVSIGLLSCLGLLLWPDLDVGFS